MGSKNSSNNKDFFDRDLMSVSPYHVPV